jgi:glycosyltransferase involved in cell wall biosynthesis
MNVSVKYSGPWAEASGYAQANRNIIQALHTAGVDIVTEKQVYANHPTNYGDQLKLALSLENIHQNYPIKILHITPNVYHRHKEVGKYHIGHLFWETTGLARDWAWYLKEVDEIWTGCQYNVECFRNAGFNRPIHVFPQAIETENHAEPMPIQNARGFKFYSIFQWTERKNPKLLLQSYWKEFENEQNVTLVLKTYRLSFDQYQKEIIYKEIEKWKKELDQAHYPRVVVIDYLLSSEEIHRLHESGDCFVSAHRGEGWGVPQVEALVHGKPVITTNLGGMHEWISDAGMFKVDYEMTPVFNMREHEQYTTDQQWAQADIGSLRTKMRYVFDNQEEAKKVGQIGKEEVARQFNYKTVGDMMKKRIEDIYQEQHFGG